MTRSKTTFDAYGNMAKNLVNIIAICNLSRKSNHRRAMRKTVRMLTRKEAW